MPRTIEEIEQRLDQLCKQYLKGPHSKELHAKIIELRNHLEELKKAGMKRDRVCRKDSRSPKQQKGHV